MSIVPKQRLLGDSEVLALVSEFTSMEPTSHFAINGLMPGGDGELKHLP